jgi:hypothetical protein
VQGTPSDAGKLLKGFLEVSHKIDSLGLFSLNESIEECSTASLRYMAVGYYLGMLTQRLPTGSLEERIDALSLALEQLGGFLDLVRAYEVDGIPDAKEEAKMDRRNVKIERFRRARQLAERVGLYSAPASADEEVVRGHRLDELRLRATQAIDEVDLIAAELEILRFKQHSAEPEYAPPAKPAAAAAPPAIPGLRRVMQSFTLVKGRDTLRKEVFRPGHRLPTMTVEEYLELERRRGGIVDGGGPQSGRVVDEQEKEDGTDYDEVEVYKERQLDAFKDEHRRGSGNTYNRG